MKNHLEWPEMGWERFQRLSLYLAQEKYKNLNLEEFLKRGNKQDGIDLISTTLENGYTAIQCKFVKSLGLTELNKIKKEFEDGRFYEKTSLFILTTTADLQKSDLRIRIDEHKVDLAKKNVVYEVWDRIYFETQLRKFYSLVASFFSKNNAENYCFLPGSNQMSFIDLGSSYIPRRVYPLNNKEQDSYWRWDRKRLGLTTLTEVFANNRFETHRICLIGDPYQGKSYLLKQTAHELTELNIPYRPIIVALKSHVIRPVEEILETEIGTWKDTPSMDLVVILDGLDEVVGDRFNDALRYIGEFVKRYPNVSLIFSCRKLFYNQYNVANHLSGFKIFDLYSLSEDAVLDFLKQRLPTSHQEFTTKVNKLNLMELILSPFYLSEFILSFEVNYEIPNSRLKAIDQFIERSIEKSSDRQINAGTLFREREREYILATHKIAFALQLMGLNALEEKYIQTLIPANERDLLKHSGIITIENGKWSFTSALFQEFLSARVLLELDTSEVIKLITVGKDIKKIKSKWLQTYSTLLEITSSGSEKEEKYLNVLAEDNIDLIFKTERSKYSSAFRLSTLMKFTEKYAELGIRPIAVREYEIGEFIGSDQACIEHLIECLVRVNESSVFKITCGSIILNCELDPNTKERLAIMILNEFRSTIDISIATQSLELLDFCAYHKDSIIEEALTKDSFCANHNYRCALYRYITHAQLTNKYYDFGIEGLPVLIEYNANISHILSEHSLIEFLLDNVNYLNLVKFYELISTEEWNGFVDRHDIFRKEIYLKRLSHQTSRIFADHPGIIFKVIEHIIAVNKKELNQEYFELDYFFQETRSHRIVIGTLYKEILGSQGWKYGGFLSEETIPYLMFEYEEGNYNPSSLWPAVIALERLPYKKEIAKQLGLIASTLRDLEPVNDDQRKWKEQEQFQLKVEKNDLAYIQSREKFIAAIRKFFKASGKSSLIEDELYVEFDDKSNIRRQVASNFLFSFLRCFVKCDKVSLQDCLEYLSNENSYNYYRATELKNYNLANRESFSNVYKKILEAYFRENVLTVAFENTFKDKPRKVYSRKAVLLGEIYKKLQPPLTVELRAKIVWIDNGDYRELFHNYNQSHTSIAELIIKDLSDAEKLAFKEQILANMQKEILSEQVFGTHIAICVHLNIKSARDLIFNHIVEIKDHTDFWRLGRYIDAYVKLGGECQKLKHFLDMNLFGDCYFFICMADHLKSDFPDFVQQKMSDFLEDENIPEAERSIVALKLIDLGSTHGFTYVIDLIKNKKLSPTDIPDRYSMEKIDTEFALSEIKKVRSLLLLSDNEDNEVYWKSARRTLIEWIYQLAGKSETDLKFVLTFYKQAGKDFAKHERVSDFNFYAEQCKEKFKESGKYPDDIKLILSFVNRVPMLL